MKAGKIFFIFWLLLWSKNPGIIFGQESGIVFFEGTWAEALEKAKTENKGIFLAAYASWCGPCKRMANEIFPLLSVGSYYNDRFINVKMDMEKGEGPQLAEMYEVEMYPTYIFLDKGGKLTHRSLGQMSETDFIIAGQTAETGLGYYTLRDKYRSGKADPIMLYHYAMRIEEAGGDVAELNKVANLFLASEAIHAISPEDLHSFIMKVSYDDRSSAGKMLLADKESFIKQFGQDAITNKIFQFSADRIDEAVMDRDKNLFVATLEYFSSNTSGTLAAELKQKLELQYYEGIGDWVEYAGAAEKYLAALNQPNWQAYNQIAWNIYENIEELELINKAVGWIEKSVAMEKNYYNLDTYAALLMKAGDYEQALVIADEAIAKAKVSHIDPKETIALTEKIKAKKN